MHVVATAGHVDHGKSTLVRALTGMEPDRWAEERRRGMTIDLGFAWTSLPSGQRIAFVDVPGHERFVTNMLAGVGPAPAVMFVVAADEGWMPQSAEHLAAIDALGVRHGLLVVTRSDLADPGPALAQARSKVGSTSLREAEAVAVSGTTGAGLAELRRALDRLTSRLPAPDPQAPLRLWVDRAFTVKGSGTVVTGTLPAGTVQTGDELVLAPTGRPVRIRALQSLNEGLDTVTAVARVALNLRGVDQGDVTRGMALVAPDQWTATDVVDVRVSTAMAAPPRELTLHIGSARVPARVRPLGADTMRLTLAATLPLHVADRILLRDPGSREMTGAIVLDVRPPSLRRRGAAAARAHELSGWPDIPGAEVLLRQHGVLRRAELTAMGCPVGDEPVVLAGGAVPQPSDWLADPDHWAGLRSRLAEAVERHGVDNPLEPGLPAEAARRLLGLPDRRLVEALVRPPVRLDAGRLYGSAAGPRLPEPVAKAVRRLRDDLEPAAFRAPEADRLAELGLTGKALAAAVRAGALLQLGNDVVLLPGAEMQAVRILADLPQPFTAGEAKRALETTRRVAIPLLEHLDRLGHTAREGDRRRVRPGGPSA